MHGSVTLLAQLASPPMVVARAHVKGAALTRLADSPADPGEPEMPSTSGQAVWALASAFLAFLKSRTFCSEAGSVTSATER